MLPLVPQYARGRVEPPNLAHLKALSERRHGRRMRALLADPLPAKWDSVSLGWVPGIKDQGQCGSCWCFSGTGVVEIAFIKAGVFPADGSMALSEQYTLSCGNNGGCNGDDNTNVLDWAKKTGIPLTRDYGTYTASRGHCQFKQGMTLYKIDDWGFCDGTGSGVTATDLIKAAIREHGSVGCAVDAGFGDPGTGVISGHGNNIDHDVVLVGWDDSKGRSGAWIMRNSWGTRWANGGYAWIEYGSFSIGTEAVWAQVVGTPQNIDFFV